MRSNVGGEEDQGNPRNADARAQTEESDGQGRRILINLPQGQKYKSNEISTAKYNLFTFIPKFLFEQFRRYANIFFLCIGLLQQIPGVSPTGKYVTIVPLFVILTITAVKEMVEDIKRHKADSKVNHTKVKVLTSTGEWIHKKWMEVCVGDILNIENSSFFPADLILLASSEPQGMCYIETANLDGETNLKIRSGLVCTSELTDPKNLARLTGQVEAEQPNRSLYEFAGNIVLSGEQAVPVSATQLLLRGARLRNTNWVHGLVVYTGHESKLLMNSTKAPLKRSTVDIVTNYQIIFLFVILVCLSLISAIGNLVKGNNGEDHEFYIKADSNLNNGFGWQFITFFILYNNLIPISLQVTLEIVKFIQAYYMNWDEAMHYIDPEMGVDSYALARTSNLNEELGQIKYVFSDKTGTLTRNVMEYKKCSVAGVMYDPEREFGKQLGHKDLVDNLKQGTNSPEMISDFLTLLTVCHTVIPEQGEDGVTRYNAASPDEKALVEGAEKYDYRFVARRPESVTIKTCAGKMETYQVLNVIEFTSTRKRMSIVVKTPSGEIKLYIKGADSVILERLGQNREQREHYDTTLNHLEEFAKCGLRTLCLGVATIPLAQYEEWNRRWVVASTAINDREEQIDEVATSLETNLTLIGATAIEDKLQDQVPETIEKLLEANIHVWMLTGDKQETAINIAKSCRLHRDNSDLFIINSRSPEEAREEIQEQLKELKKDGLVGKSNDITLVTDGKSLNYTLLPDMRKDFIDLCTSCRAVVCCRVSPIQKADMVELVKEHTGAITLSIGDGANDVAMIQKAAVGVGISGNEGLQAANSADFAIAQFRFLSRLLFVHGAWNYSRISKVILYSFYKNITLYIIELWFAIYNYWSGQVIYERWTIGMYNLFFTSAPPVALGLFDRTCTAATREEYPSLYHSTQKSEFFNHREFWKWIANSIVHSVLLFWLPQMAMYFGVSWESGQTDGYLVLGNTVYTLVVVTTCLKAGIEMDAWTWFSHGSIWGSIALWFLFLVIYSHIWPSAKFVASNMAGMSEILLSSPVFWFCLLLVPTVTLLADVAFRAIKTTVFTTETDKIRIAEVMNKEVAVYVEGGRRPISETSRLLRNVRKRFRKNKQRQEEQATMEMDVRHGYAFSQEEAGAVSQGEYIRRYDTTRPRSTCTMPRVSGGSSPQSSHSLPPATRSLSAHTHIPGRIV
eukprot:GFUD01119777.1.p1 GENE.GFUD01119777.1~~GFUD01119777.1.p1  ORF type:complete len:1194 (-),score=278.48 GFUD01119777.1:164-3745(-)